MELYRLGVKFFAEDPASVSLHDFIPIFHTWIQKQILGGHLLIDVHDYSHIHQGPGILLVSHEANLSIDAADGRPGLLYYRKQPGTDFATIVKSALQACRLLEGEASLKGRVRFRADELLVVANDRLNAPNDEQTFTQLQPIISSDLKRIFEGAEFELSRSSHNAKDRLTIACRRLH